MTGAPQLQVPKPPLGLTGWLLLGAAVMLLAGNMSAAFSSLYEQGQLPIKPRDIILGLSGVTLLTLWFHRPAFAPAALLLLLIPTLRVIDSGVLKRFTHEALGDHSYLVFGLILVWVVVFIAVCSMATAHGRRIALYSAIAVIFLDTGSLVYESMGYAQYTSIPGRVSGFLRQPNDAIIVMCLMLSVVFTLNQNFWLNVSLIAIAAVGVVLTLSRSGMMVFAVLIMLFVLLNFRQHYAKLLLVAGISIPIASAGLAWFIHSATTASFGTDTNIKNRIEAIFGGSTDKMASDERMKDLTDGWEAVTESPLFGHGTGCASSMWQPHNQWVAIWLDIGIAGVLIFASTLIAITLLVIAKRGTAVYCLVPLWMFSMFSQNLVEMACYWFTASVALHELTTGRFRIGLKRPNPLPAAAPHYS
jgi:O-antigen ligase